MRLMVISLKWSQSSWLCDFCFVFGFSAQRRWKLDLTKFRLFFFQSSIIKRKRIKRVERLNKEIIMKMETKIDKEGNEDMGRW